MYGTVAHLRTKPGEADDIVAMFEKMAEAVDPGEVAAYIDRPEAQLDSLIIVAVFESREAYVANAERPETHQRFMELRSHLAEDPVWNDGSIIQHLA